MRIEELKKSMLEIGIDHLLISDTKLIEYVLGKRFYVGERFIGLLVQEDKPILFLNLLFPYQNTEIEIVRFHDIDDPIRMLTERLDGIDLAIDRNLASGFLLRLLKHKPGLRVIDGSFAIDRIRAKKSPDELELLREASRINDKIMAEVRQQLREGVSEIEIADFITQRFNEVADGVSFLPIVAFGDHTADPHAECSNRKLEVGMPVIIDMGCVKDGYCSDMTRSFSFQKAWNSEIYELVTKANLAGIASVKPGVRLSDIDTAARRVIEAAGYGTYFIHRLGHGIGTEIHEPFDVSQASEVIAFEGMCFSIEPGIYIEGQGGVRIEDLIIVTASGCEVLNVYPKDNEVIA